MTWLLDGSVLVALILADHPQHQRVRRWRLSQKNCPFATCAITEGTLLRLHMQFAADTSSEAAWQALATLQEHPLHQFWDDSFSYQRISPLRLTGHRQITDSWLAELARLKGAKLATLDHGLAALWPQTAELIPVV
ncbi:TA system VapC family ribonuclease toxin [Roseibacillus ishigakijimensis]|uniref:Ribonuclease VapC n=1 Tax=Roseibacillus ishigakijimensis TaxID=454146 RepID=A0A934RU99_9BACT|nr:TA system VapC family ribonuclease toxin [Roseibacillus ishigakijimensis]MBK1834606.1 PIN domain-containing protein [Roseibacillus ishigakijimensis]